MKKGSGKAGVTRRRNALRGMMGGSGKAGVMKMSKGS